MKSVKIRKYRVIHSHQASYDDPLVAKKGDPLIPKKKESEWPGWIWCEHASEKPGWVPESWLHIEDGLCTLKKDYNATERAVSPGEILSVAFFESDWAWVTTADGQEGWVPRRCLEEM